MLDSIGFDLWANGYDKSVNLSEKNNEYPFAGYKDVLNYVYNQVRERDGTNVLDIGFGTGILTTQLYNNGYNITGIDFSSNMIGIAKQKMPQATFINQDFSKGLPCEIKNYHFDFIISTYAIHHLTDKEKINFIKSLLPMLNKTGMILFGDVSFVSRNQLEKCKTKYNEYWDYDEIYFTVEEIKNNLNDEYFCEYIQISHCAGVLTIANK